MAGLSTQGFVARRASDFRALIIAAFDATGLNYDFSDDQPLGFLINVCAELMGEQSETQRAVYDERNQNNASGVQLDDIGAMVGVTRAVATYSSVTLTLTGTDTTVIPAGTLMQGGGPDGLAFWSTSAEVAIGDAGAGVASVVATCTVTGPIAAPASSVTVVDTPIVGLDSVTNPAAAALGSDIETDASFRQRQRAEINGGGANRSIRGIRAALEAVDGVTAASVEENATAAPVGSLGAYSTRAVLYPSSLTTTQRNAAALVLYQRIPLGISTSGSQSATVTDLVTDVSRVMYWDWATAVSVTVAMSVTVAAGETVATVTPGIESALASLFSTLGPGDDVYLMAVIKAVATVDGVLDVSGVTLNGTGTSTSVDYDEIATLSTITVS